MRLCLTPEGKHYWQIIRRVLGDFVGALLMVIMLIFFSLLSI